MEISKRQVLSIDEVMTVLAGEITDSMYLKLYKYVDEAVKPIAPISTFSPVEKKEEPNAQKPKMKDTDTMLYGKKYKGLHLIDVPKDYMLWAYHEGNVKGDLRDYIHDTIVQYEKKPYKSNKR